jgi:CCR4-NOT transcription complex subunit 7/8
MRPGAALNNFGAQYHYGQNPQAHAANNMAPPLASNPGFMNANSMSNPFAMNGNSLNVGNFGGSGLGMPGGTGLASQAAQMGFANAQMQQQGHNGMGEPGSRGQAHKGRIRDVWKSNLHEEMAEIRKHVQDFPYIAMVRTNWKGGVPYITDTMPGY